MLILTMMISAAAGATAAGSDKSGSGGKGGGKTLGELMSDPHFIVTILSLILSVSVFFYYLYQLLCHPDDENEEEEEGEGSRGFRWTGPRDKRAVAAAAATKPKSTEASLRAELKRLEQIEKAAIGAGAQVREEVGADKKTDEPPGPSADTAKNKDDATATATTTAADAPPGLKHRRPPAKEK